MIRWIVALVLVISSAAMGWTRTDTLRVLASGDDVRIVGSDFSATGTLYRGYLAGGGRCSIAERMQSKVPAGQTITSAYYVPAAAYRAGTDTTKIYMEYANNAAAITSTTDFNGRTLTSDSLDYTIPGTWTDGTRYSFTITTLFSAVYEAGYADSGEYCNIFCLGRNQANANHYRSSYPYDGDAGSASWIIVVHETATAPSSTPKGLRRKIIQMGSIEPVLTEWGQWEAVQ